MQALNLLNLVYERTAHPVLWHVDCERIDLQTVLSWIKFASVWRDSFAGKKVAISCVSNRSLMLALVLLDGVADTLLLLPEGLSGELIDDLKFRAGIQDMICEAKTQTTCPHHHVLPDLTSKTIGKTSHGISNAKSTPTRWLIPTSGTTGIPKLVPHTLQTLMRSTKRDYSKGSSLRWGLLYDISRFAGLQVFLQALAGGSQLLVPPAGASIIDQIEFLVRNECNALSSTPTMWRKLLMNPSVLRLQLSHITLGGEIADKHILKALSKKFPNATIRHIYASTEAGVGFVVTDGRAGFPSSYLSEPPPGLSLIIREADGMLLMRPAGENPSHYIDGRTQIQDGEGWIETGDLVSLEGDRVYFLGRASGAINVGGAKVHPSEIEACLHELPWVLDVMVRGKRNAFSGNIVEAFIVISEGLPAEYAIKARDHCRSKLEPYKVPAVVHVKDTLPTTTTGKLIRE